MDIDVSRRRARLGFSTLLLGILIAGAFPAEARADAAACTRTIHRAYDRYVAARAKIVDRCRDSAVRRGTPADPAACPTSAYDAPLTILRQKLHSQIAADCGGSDDACNGAGDLSLASIGWDVGTCPGIAGAGQTCTNAIATCDDVATCVGCIADQVLDGGAGIAYDRLDASQFGSGSSLNSCQRALGKETLRYLKKRAKLGGKCWDKVLTGSAGFVDPPGCPTTNAKTLASLAKAEAKKIANICRSCGGGGDADGDGACDGVGGFSASQIGFAADCPDVTVPGTGRACGQAGVASLDSVIACVDCVAEYMTDCGSAIAAASPPVACADETPPPVGGTLTIDEAIWTAATGRFRVDGRGEPGADVVLSDAITGGQIAVVNVGTGGLWTHEQANPTAVPCRVRAVSVGTSREKDVDHAESFPGGCSASPGGAAGMKHDLVIPMNYELGMHCTGFDFSYCCVLPPYNSILAQVVKTEKTAPKATAEDEDHQTGEHVRIGRPTMLGADPGDHTIVLDPETQQRYRLLYWHEDQRTRSELGTLPAGDCPGCSPTTAGDDAAGHILNSAAEGEKLIYWSAYYDLGKGTSDITDPAAIQASGDNFANAVFRHLYIYADAEGTIPGGTTDDSAQLNFGIELPIAVDSGPAGHRLSSRFNADGTLADPQYLTFTGKTGTVVYTDAPITPFDDFPTPRADVVQLDNVPIVLTNPGIWEALGLPLTPFPDGIDLMSPDLTESSVRPYVRMTVQVVDLNDQPVLDSEGEPMTFFGNAPIDIPNCERCHSGANANDRADLGGPRTVDTAGGLMDIPTLVASEYDYWRNTVGLSDWYARVKSSAISMLAVHDAKHGTGFVKSFDPTSSVQTSFLSRLGRQTVMCQDCHADNVIGVLSSKKVHEIPERDRGFLFDEIWGDVTVPGGPGDTLIPALTEAIHGAHLGHSPAWDGQGRSGSCQGCHPAHRSDGSLDNYPITEDGLNAFGPEGGNPSGDNREAAGGCFVGRDVHSNPLRYGEISAGHLHLNAVGQWLLSNVATENGEDQGIWCTNCHTQVQRELYKADHLTSPFDPNSGTSARDAADLADLAAQLNAINGTSYSTQDLMDLLDPGQVGVGGAVRSANQTLSPWAPGRSTANIASVSVDATVAAGPDVDGEFNVAVVGLDPSQVPGTDLFGNPAPADTMLVPFDAADDGRDYWLSAGSPKCADCHQPPFVESLGGVSKAFALQLGLATEADLKETDSGAFPINQPFKYSNFRYSKGHQGLTCQGCHESIHGLYPTTPPGFVGARAVDETTWEQAALLNDDSSHGPVKCASCHETNANGTVKGTHRIRYQGVPIDTDLQTSIAWAHQFMAGSSKLSSTCLRCHGDESEEVRCSELQTHINRGRIAARHANAVAEELGLGCAF